MRLAGHPGGGVCRGGHAGRDPHGGEHGYAPDQRTPVRSYERAGPDPGRDSHPGGPSHLGNGGADPDREIQAVTPAVSRGSPGTRPRAGVGGGCRPARLQPACPGQERRAAAPGPGAGSHDRLLTRRPARYSPQCPCARICGTARNIRAAPGGVPRAAGAAVGHGRAAGPGRAAGVSRVRESFRAVSGNERRKHVRRRQAEQAALGPNKGPRRPNDSRPPSGRNDSGPPSGRMGGPPPWPGYRPGTRPADPACLVPVPRPPVGPEPAAALAASQRPDPGTPRARPPGRAGRWRRRPVSGRTQVCRARPPGAVWFSAAPVQARARNACARSLWPAGCSAGFGRPTGSGAGGPAGYWSPAGYGSPAGYWRSIGSRRAAISWSSGAA